MLRRVLGVIAVFVWALCVGLFWRTDPLTGRVSSLVVRKVGEQDG
jgi:hypothetical protein